MDEDKQTITTPKYKYRYSEERNRKISEALKIDPKLRRSKLIGFKVRPSLHKKIKELKINSIILRSIVIAYIKRLEEVKR